MIIKPDPKTGVRRDPFAWRRVADPYENDVLSTFLSAMMGMAMLKLVADHADSVGGVLREVARPLRWLFDGSAEV